MAQRTSVKRKMQIDAGGCVWLARHCFLLVFYNDLMSIGGTDVELYNPLMSSA